MLVVITWITAIFPATDGFIKHLELKTEPESTRWWFQPGFMGTSGVNSYRHGDTHGLNYYQRTLWAIHHGCRADSRWKHTHTQARTFSPDKTKWHGCIPQPTGVPADAHPTNSLSCYESWQVLVTLLSVCSKENLNSIPALANNPIRKQIVDAFFDKRCVSSRQTRKFAAWNRAKNITFSKLPLLVPPSFVSFLKTFVFHICNYYVIFLLKFQFWL